MFKMLIERKILKINSPITIQELKAFVLRNGKYQAQHGSTDDTISALMIVVRIMEKLAKQNQEVFNALYGYETESFDNTDSLFDEEDSIKYNNDNNIPPVII